MILYLKNNGSMDGRIDSSTNRDVRAKKFHAILSSASNKFGHAKRQMHPFPLVTPSPPSSPLPSTPPLQIPFPKNKAEYSA